LVLGPSSIFAGVDVGSVATKAVILGDGNVLGSALVATGASPRQAAETALAKALSEARKDRSSIGRVVSTGYGRRATEMEGAIVTEITAAARGAHWIGAPWGAVRTVVDLGGQDTKVILLDPEGNVADFVMNDKCAAGTGRFLSLMSATLEMDIAEMGDLSSRSKEPVAINSTCAVFAESEVISLIAQGRRKEDIIAGLHAAIASRIATMVRQMGGHQVFFSGGGARNSGVRRALESALREGVHVPPEPQFIVATGAALIAAGAGACPRNQGPGGRA